MNISEDRNYIHLIGSRLRNFTWLRSGLAACSCPVCGDSTTNKLKRRCYFIPTNNGNYGVYCHNCQYSSTLSKFLETQFPDVYKDYRFAAFSNTTLTDFTDSVQEIKPEVKDFSLNGLVNLSYLPYNSEVIQYCESRKIPTSMYNRIYFTENYREWVVSQLPDKFSNTEKDDPRLVFPLETDDKYLIGCSGRATLQEQEPRYINVIFNNEIVYPHLYYYNYCNKDETIVICEGQIDSLFVKNACAMSTVKIDLSLVNKEKCIICLDNQPRNKQVVQRLEGYIQQKYNVCIWPKSIKQKDINLMVLNGIQDINDVIHSNTYSGLRAKIELAKWSEI